MFNKENLPNNEISSYHGIANCYDANYDIENSIKYFKVCLNLAQKEMNVEKIAEFSLKLSSLYFENKNDYIKSYDYALLAWINLNIAEKLKSNNLLTIIQSKNFIKFQINELVPLLNNINNLSLNENELKFIGI